MLPLAFHPILELLEARLAADDKEEQIECKNAMHPIGVLTV